MPQSRPSMAVRPQSGPGDELTASDIRAAWLPLVPIRSRIIAGTKRQCWNLRGTGTDSSVFPSVQTAVIADPCWKPQILRQVCSIDLTVAGAAYESGSSGKIYAGDAERCSYRYCAPVPGARQREIVGLPAVSAR